MGSIIALARMLASEYIKIPLAFLSDLIIPLVLFVVVFLSTGRGDDPLIGILVALAWASGGFTLARKLALYRQYKLLEVFIASPISQLEFAIAAALAHLIVLLGPAIVITILLIAVSGYAGVGLILMAPLVIASWALGILFGIYLFNRLDDPVRINSLATLINLGLIMLPPVIYPIDLLPEWIQKAAVFIPTVALKYVTLYVFKEFTGPTPIIEALVVVMYFILFGLLALKSNFWGEAR